ncbi:MAG: hypothetical protein PHV07_08950, partial [Oscillospiraceae bacterium]|nr:hypothetical protein [Oscillospiraceae bacterium]
FNAEKLEAQLQKQQHISIREFTAGPKVVPVQLERFDRRKHLKMPPVDYYQLKVSYDAVVDKQRDTAEEILHATDSLMNKPVTHVVDINFHEVENRSEDTALGNPVTYNQWLYAICKESFDRFPIPALATYTNELNQVFERITVVDGGIRRYRGDCDQIAVRSHIRVAFTERATLHTNEDTIPESASLLRIENLISPFPTTHVETVCLMSRVKD